MYGVTPPVATSVWLYALPTVPFGRLVVVMFRADGLTTMDRAWSSVSGVPWESVTRTVKLEVLAVVGVPEIVPVDEPSDSPAGSDPEMTDHVYGRHAAGGRERLAVRRADGAAGQARGRDDEIRRADVTVIESAWSSVAATLSVTRTVKLEVPAAVGRAAYGAGRGAERKPRGQAPGDDRPRVGASCRRWPGGSGCTRCRSLPPGRLVVVMVSGVGPVVTSKESAPLAVEV